MAGLFNFPPYDQSGSTGFLDPALAYQAQASLLGQQGAPQPAPQPQGMSWGGGGSIWPMLTALGAGIAGKSGEGWGSGIGAGLALSQEQQRLMQNDDYKKLLLAIQMQQAQATQGYRNRQLAQGDERNQIARTNAERAGIPAGFERTQDGRLAPVSGGPADPEYLRNKPDRQHIPAGYDWDPNDPSKLVPIPGGPASKLPQSAAGAVGMMDTAEKEMTAVKAKDVLKNMGNISGDIKGFLGMGDVGRAQRSVRLAVEASLRLMTGAAAPDQEVNRYTDMFTPQGWDSVATREQKMRALQEFMNSARANLLQGREPPREPKVGEEVDPFGIR